MQKLKVTQQQRDNAIQARDVMWPSVPEANVADRLLNWGYSARKPLTCGTVACFGGWSEAWPPFREQLGLRDGDSASWGRIAELFGSSDDDETNRIFNVRGQHPADRRFRGTDHALVMNRLHWLIRNTVVE